MRTLYTTYIINQTNNSFFEYNCVVVNKLYRTHESALLFLLPLLTYVTDSWNESAVKQQLVIHTK